MHNAVAADFERRLHALPDDSPDTRDLHLALARSVDSLDRLVGCSFHPIPLPMRSPGWTYYNPSIAVDPDGGYRCALRHSSYPLVRGPATFSEPFIVKLNDLLEVSEARHIAPLERAIIPRFLSTYGPEDMRLFRVHGRWFATASFSDAPQCAVGGKVQIRIGLMHFGDDFKWTKLDILPGRVTQNEKNWMPIEGSLSWLYTVHNTLRGWIQPETQKFAYAPPQSTPRELRFARGGTQIINVNNDYALGVVHETLYPAPDSQKRQIGYGRAYLHRFVLYRRDPFCLAAMSPLFHFLTPASTEFAAGLALKGEQLVISFGHHDMTSWLAQARLADVMRALKPV